MGLIELGPWDQDPEVWSRLEIDGKQVPGLAKVSGLVRANKWDTKKAEGSHGADRNFKGADLATGHLEIKILTKTEADAFVADWLPILEPIEKTQQIAHRINHPMCKWRRVVAFTVDKVAGPDDQGNGIWTFSIDITEARDPTAKNGSGKAVAKGLTGRCAELAADYAIAQLNYVTYHQTAVALGKKVLGQEGGFGQNVSDAATYEAKAQLELAKMLAISAEQIARSCGSTAPSAKPATVAP